MPEVTQLQIKPPLAGVIRSRGFQAQPPFSCRQAINYWPQYALDGTELLATRPPLDEHFEPATTGAVNMAQRVNGTTSNTPQRSLVVARNGDLFFWNGAGYTAITMGALSVPASRALFATTLGQKVYIPDVAPLVYDYASDTLSAWTATSGTVPSDARAITTWLGSIVVAAVPDEPHIVSLSATNDGLNWNFSASGEGAAWSSIGDEGGLISDPVTALIPTPGDSLIVSTPDSLFIWRAHPRRGGVADVLNPAIGVRGQGAWCADEKGHIFMLTNRGLSVFDGSTVTHISKERIPSDLIGFTYDYLDPRVSMGYDVTFDKIHICVRDDTTPTAWTYDLKHGGLWEADYEAALPYVMTRFDPLGTARASDLLFCGEDGIHRFDLDGTEDFPRHRVVVGPMRLSQDATARSKITEAQFVFGGGTDDTTAEVALYGGRTADSAYAAATSGLTPVKHVTTIADIFKSRGIRRPNISDHAACLVINQTEEVTNPVVVLEEANLKLIPAGRATGPVFHSDTSGPLAGGFVYAGTSLLTGLLSYHKLDEASSITRQDAHTGNIDLAVTGTVNAADGKIGAQSAVFTEGANALTGTIALDTSEDFTDGFAVSLWWFPTNDANGASIFQLHDGEDSACDLTIGVGGSGLVPSFEVQNINGKAGTAQATTHVALNEWHHIVAWVDIENNIAGLSVDGTVYTGTLTDASGSLSLTHMNVGSSDLGGTAFSIAGRIDEVGVWTRALSAGNRNRLNNSDDGLAFSSFT